jgi:hypothetical protein
VTRLAWVLRDLPVELIGRIRGDRVMRLPKPPRVSDPKGGRPPKHGPEFRFAKPGSWPDPAVTTRTPSANYGKAVMQAWDRVHPRLTHRAAWLDHEGELPLIEGTLIRLEVEHLSKDREAPAVWLWSSRTGSSDADVDRAWQAFLRRFDLEHTFRLFKQTLGWTRPRLREPEAADRWTWLIIAAYTQLRLARPLARDLRHPWEKPVAQSRLTPARVRRTFRNLRQHMPCPARAPKPHQPGPGRPPGTRNRRRPWGYPGTGPGHLYDALAAAVLDSWEDTSQWLNRLAGRRSHSSGLWKAIQATKQHDPLRIPWPKIVQWTREDQKAAAGQ